MVTFQGRISRKPKTADRKFILGAALAALLLASCAPQSADSPGPAAGEAEILWDTWGVPHIYASDAESLFYANGWAQTRARGDLMLRLYGESRGRAAEYWGEEKLELDRWVRTVGIPSRAQRWYEAQEEPFKSYLDAFAQGVNDYAQQHSDQLADDVKAVLPATPVDLLAHTQRVVQFEFVTSPRVLSALRRRSEGPAGGSNAWAIGPSRADGGKAMLLANPHLPWSGLFLWNEVHFVMPNLNLYGASLVGQPLVGIGFNDHVGWTHTVNTIDAQDLYALKLTQGGYRWDGGVKPFELSEETLKVKQEDGSFREERFVIKRSVHGPVLIEKGGEAIALRVAGLDRPYLTQQYWEMAKARNFAEFESAVKKLQMPMFTVIYADRDGHVFSLFGGLTPKRPEGKWNWRGVVPGDTAKTLWTESLAYDALPQVLDPPSGWVQNANEPPWTTTLPYQLDADDFPSYLAPRFMSFRAQRSARMLAEDEKISLDEMIRYKHSTRMELADRLLDDLLPLLEKRGRPLDKEIAETLRAWDRSADSESRGAILFSAFWRELGQDYRGGNPFSEKWKEEDPLDTPDGIADPARVLAALSKAAKSVKERYGALDPAWGDFHRLRRGNVDLPANGGPGSLGIFRVVRYEGDEGGPQQAFFGDSFVAAVEFSDPPRAMVLTAYGASSDPDSPHYSDQLELFARKQLRPAWRTRAEIEAHLEDRTVLKR